MSIQLPDLPYAGNALEPHISAQTLDFHHGKHHKAYVDKLNAAISGTDYEGQSLEAIVRIIERTLNIEAEIRGKEIVFSGVGCE